MRWLTTWTVFAVAVLMTPIAASGSTFDDWVSDHGDSPSAVMPGTVKANNFPIDSFSGIGLFAWTTKPEFAKHHATDARRARHGRPPSKWLRSLYADELPIWLRTIEVPAAGVIGMTYWTHLTRDHLFDADHITGLTEPEQAKLHGAAHFGY